MVAHAWRERFAAFVEKKTREACTAALPRYATEREQPLHDMIAIGNDWTRDRFDGAFYLSPSRQTHRPSCSLVFVQSSDGNTGAANPGDLGGGNVDLHVVYEGLSRVAADAVLSGAETVRDSQMVFSVWHPELVALRASLGLPRHPVQMVATLRGVDVDRMLLFNVPDLRVVVITLADCGAHMRDALRARPWVTVIEMTNAREIATAFAQLPSLGISRISCIGGRRLAANLLDAHLIDDVYLTTSARRGGDPGTPLSPRATSGRLVLRKQGTGEETGIVFDHFATASPLDDPTR